MQLSNIAILAIRGHAALRKELAKALDVHPGTINRYVNENSDDLTKAAALELIRRELQLPDDQLFIKQEAAA